MNLSAEAVWLRTSDAWWPSLYFKTWEEASFSYRVILIQKGLTPNKPIAYGIAAPLHDSNLITIVTSKMQIRPFEEHLESLMFQTIEKVFLSTLYESISKMIEVFIPLLLNDQSEKSYFSKPSMKKDVPKTVCSPNHLKSNNGTGLLQRIVTPSPLATKCTNVKVFSIENKSLCAPKVDKNRFEDRNNSLLMPQNVKIGDQPISPEIHNFSKIWEIMKKSNWTWDFGNLSPRVYLRPGVKKGNLCYFKENVHYFYSDEALIEYLSDTWIDGSWNKDPPGFKDILSKIEATGKLKKKVAKPDEPATLNSIDAILSRDIDSIWPFLESLEWKNLREGKTPLIRPGKKFDLGTKCKYDEFNLETLKKFIESYPELFASKDELWGLLQKKGWKCVNDTYIPPFKTESDNDIKTFGTISEVQLHLNKYPILVETFDAQWSLLQQLGWRLKSRTYCCDTSNMTFTSREKLIYAMMADPYEFFRPKMQKLKYDAEQFSVESEVENTRDDVSSTCSSMGYTSRMHLAYQNILKKRAGMGVAQSSEKRLRCD